MRTAVLPVLLVVVGGCTNGRPEPAPPGGEPGGLRQGGAPLDWGDMSRGGTLDPGAAWLTGELGVVGPFDVAADEVTAWSGPGTEAVTLVAHLPEGSVLTAVRIDGALDSIVADTTPASLIVIGCSGPPGGGWEFDQPADDVELDVDQGDGGPVVSFTARFGSQEVEGRFALAAAP
jgi:hypothetical protein